jgi:glycosyltransferase involved in cell wall biosynthesis
VFVLREERLRISAIVCAYNEDRYIGPCLHSLLTQTRPADDIVLVNNASSDHTAAVARRICGVRVVEESTRGLVHARERARLETSGEILAFMDADCRAPLEWLERIERRFEQSPSLVAVTGPYRFYDWDLTGRALLRVYDAVVAPPTHLLVHHLLAIGAILYGGNFAVRRSALDAIGGFDRSVEFHGEDTNLGRRLTPRGRVAVAQECWVWTSARRYRAMGKGKVFSLYVRNFWSEILRHRPADETHLDVRT